MILSRQYIDRQYYSTPSQLAMSIQQLSTNGAMYVCPVFCFPIIIIIIYTHVNRRL